MDDSSRKVEDNSAEYVMKQLNTVVDIVQSTMYYVKTLFIDSGMLGLQGMNKLGDKKGVISALVHSILNDPNYALFKSSIDLSNVPIEQIKSEASQWIHKCAGGIRYYVVFL